MLDPRKLKPGQEQYEKYYSGVGRKRTIKFQYDYRDHNGKLYSAIGRTLEEARHMV